MTVFYSPAARPWDEAERQRAVDGSGLLEASGDPELERIIGSAAEIFGTPMAAISIIDHDRQVFPAQIGLGATETPRTVSFCAHAVLDATHPFCVTDATTDPRFAGNPLVLSGPQIRFYAGVTLIDASGQPLGALCTLDRKPRDRPTDAQFDALAALARQVLQRAAAFRGHDPRSAPPERAAR